MPLVNVMVNGRAYTIACDEGEEEHLRELGAHVDAKAREVMETVGQVGDQRMMLMAALLIADECYEARARMAAHSREAGDVAASQDALAERVSRTEQKAAEALEQAAARAESLAAALVEAARQP